MSSPWKRLDTGMLSRQGPVKRSSGSKTTLDMVTAAPWRFGCLIPQKDAEDSGMGHAAVRKPITFQLESMGTTAGGGRKGRVQAGPCCSICPSPIGLLELEGGGECQPVPKKPGSHFLPNRHLLAGHQIVLEGCVSGGCGLHYQAASPFHFCPCVPAMKIRLQDLHKAPAIYYSATARYCICWRVELNRRGLAPARAMWAPVSACAGG